MPRARRRPRAPRLSRMDAAVDAMLPYGFPEEVVKKHVKQLLKEYGGDEGWPFIEECSYTVLLDSILDEKDNQEQVSQNGDLLEGMPCGDRASDGDLVPSNMCTEAVSCTQETGTGEAADGLPAPSPPLESTNLALPASRRRRFPCYGWIESDDDDASDFILLRPSCMAIGGRATLDVTTWRKKRRSRWDVKPGDPS